MAKYNPAVFDAPDEATARRIILTPEGRETDDRWERETAVLTTLSAAVLRPTSTSLVLDYGCGIGRMAKALIARFGCRVVGVDISPRMRALAVDYVASDRFEVITPRDLQDRGDLRQAFDAALAVWVLQHTLAPAEDIGAIAASLKREGRLLVVNNRRRVVPTVERPWTDDGLDVAQLLGAQLEPLQVDALPPGAFGEAVAQFAFWGVYAAR